MEMASSAKIHQLKSYTQNKKIIKDKIRVLAGVTN